MVSAYDTMEVPDTSMLLMPHTGRRSMKGGLFSRPHEHTQQPCKRLPKNSVVLCRRPPHSASAATSCESAKMGLFTFA